MAPRDPKALRAQVKARRAELKARLAEARAAARDTRPARARRTRRRLALLLLVLLILLLRRCDCAEPPPVAGAPDAAVGVARVVDAGPAPDAAPTPPARRPRRRLKPIAEQDRPTFDAPSGAPPKWLTALRLQVAARGPRLARCVEGAEQTSAVRWNAAIDPERGVVSDQTLEPVDGALGARKRRCLLEVLSQPPYRLEAGDAVIPPRISLVVEL